MEGFGVGGEGGAGDGAAVHGVDPVEWEGGDAVDDAADGVFVGEDAGLAVELAHGAGEVLGDDGRLIAGLDEEVGGEEAAGGLFDGHHGVPVMDVRGFD